MKKSFWEDIEDTLIALVGGTIIALVFIALLSTYMLGAFLILFTIPILLHVGVHIGLAIVIGFNASLLGVVIIALLNKFYRKYLSDIAYI